MDRQGGTFKVRWQATLAGLTASILLATAPRAHAASNGVVGTVRYYDGLAGMPAVSVALSGATQSMATTGGDGSYAFGDPGIGNWQVAPSKMGGTTAAVTTLDAACALAAAVGKQPLDSYQQLAADVTGDGKVTALDSARILQFLAGQRAHLPVADRCGSDWAFIPTAQNAPNQQVSPPQTVPGCSPGTIAFAPLASMAQGQDFVALAFGDCTAQYGIPPTATPTVRPSTSTPTPTPTFTATPIPTRDFRTWPFDRHSPWNHPIGSGAHYKTMSVLTQLPIGINYQDRWTSAVAVATTQHPVNAFLFGPSWGPNAMWEFFNAGGLTCGNSASVEAALLADAVPPPPSHDGNFYSTIATWDDSISQMPASYHHASQDWRDTFRLPVGACPSPDTDALMAVIQPDGWVLDMYNGVVVSGNRVVSSMASWIDARGDGTGWWNGRRASMLPSFAGLIRKGEINGGRIPHALAMLVPTTLLAKAYRWPAYTIDRNSGYTGTLPMGSLLAIPANVNLATLGLSSRGLILARAMQDYGAYVVDRGGNGLTILAELGNTEIRWDQQGSAPADWKDLQIIGANLTWLDNNTEANRGGGGTLRQPLSPPISANDL